MVNETNISEIMDAVNLNKGAEYLSFLSKTITNKVVLFLAEKGINVSVRWISGCMILISIALIWVALKISKPLVKWAMIILAIILLGGLVIPW